MGNFKIQTPNNIYIDEFVCLRSKAYSFTCVGKNTNNLKVPNKSQSKSKKFEEKYKCLFGEEYQKDCDNYISRSIYRDIYSEEN